MRLPLVCRIGYCTQCTASILAVASAMHRRNYPIFPRDLSIRYFSPDVCLQNGNAPGRMQDTTPQSFPAPSVGEAASHSRSAFSLPGVFPCCLALRRCEHRACSLGPRRIVCSRVRDGSSRKRGTYESRQESSIHFHANDACFGVCFRWVHARRGWHVAG